MPDPVLLFVIVENCKVDSGVELIAFLKCVMIHFRKKTLLELQAYFNRALSEDWVVYY